MPIPRSSNANAPSKPTSFKYEALQAQSSDLVEQSFPWYELKWQKLKTWLEKKFKNLTFPEEAVRTIPSLAACIGLT